jgi:hypothetical protein
MLSLLSLAIVVFRKDEGLAAIGKLNSAALDATLAVLERKVSCRESRYLHAALRQHSAGAR